jgi:hypothetical protein
VNLTASNVANKEAVVAAVVAGINKAIEKKGKWKASVKESDKEVMVLTYKGTDTMPTLTGDSVTVARQTASEFKVEKGTSKEGKAAVAAKYQVKLTDAADGQTLTIDNFKYKEDEEGNVTPEAAEFTLAGADTTAIIEDLKTQIGTTSTDATTKEYLFYVDADENMEALGLFNIIAVDGWAGAIAEYDVPTVSIEGSEEYDSDDLLAQVVRGEDGDPAVFTLTLEGTPVVGDYVGVDNISLIPIGVVVEEDMYTVSDVLDALADEINDAAEEKLSGVTAEVDGDDLVLTATFGGVWEEDKIPYGIEDHELAPLFVADDTYVIDPGRDDGDGEWMDVSLFYSETDEESGEVIHNARTEYALSLLEAALEELDLNPDEFDVDVAKDPAFIEKFSTPYRFTPSAPSKKVAVTFDWAEDDSVFFQNFYEPGATVADLVAALNAETGDYIDWEALPGHVTDVLTPGLSFASQDSPVYVVNSVMANDDTAIDQVTCGVGLGQLYSAGKIYGYNMKNDHWAKVAADQPLPGQIRSTNRTLTVDPVNNDEKNLWFVAGSPERDGCFAVPNTYSVNFRYHLKKETNQTKYTNKSISLKLTNGLFIPTVTATTRDVETVTVDSIIDALETNVDMNSNVSDNASILGLYGIWNGNGFDALTINGTKATVKYAEVLEDDVHVFVPINTEFKEEQ